LAVGLTWGVAVALLCGLWFRLEYGEGQELAFVVAAGLSLPLSQVVAQLWPASGSTPYDFWFVILVPVFNGLTVGAIVAAIVLLARARRLE
jgi:hypothetical protein